VDYLGVPDVLEVVRVGGQDVVHLDVGGYVPVEVRVGDPENDFLDHFVIDFLDHFVIDFLDRFVSDFLDHFVSDFLDHFGDFGDLGDPGDYDPGGLVG